MRAISIHFSVTIDDSPSIDEELTLVASTIPRHFLSPGDVFATGVREPNDALHLRHRDASSLPTALGKRLMSA